VVLIKKGRGIAGVKIVFGALAFIASVFCFMEAAIGFFVTYEAHRRGQIRGVPFQRFFLISVMFATATCLLGWASLKMLPLRKQPNSG
jgi:hypothetical protein